jgi:hypothetical protein
VPIDLRFMVNRHLCPPSPELVTGRYVVLPPSETELPQSIVLVQHEEVLRGVQCSSMRVAVTNARLWVESGKHSFFGWWTELERFDAPTKEVIPPTVAGEAKLLIVPEVDVVFRGRVEHLVTKPEECGFLFSLERIGTWIIGRLKIGHHRPEDIGVCPPSNATE